MEGWIKIHRKIMDWEWKSEPNMIALWIDLLCRANHAPHRWQGVDVDRGQCVVGLKSLSVSTGLSVKSVRTCLDRLKSASQVAIESNNRYSLVSIINYDGYQCSDAEQNEANGTPDGKQAANKGQTNGKQRATNKNDKNEDNEKNEKISIPRPATPSAKRQPLEPVFDIEALRNQFGSRVDNEMIVLQDWLKSSGKKYKDWQAFARNWMRRAMDKAQQPPIGYKKETNIDRAKAVILRDIENEQKRDALFGSDDKCCLPEFRADAGTARRLG